MRFFVVSAKEIRNEVRNARGAGAVNFSDTTVRPRLNRSGLHLRVAANKPHLSRNHALARLAWARAHRPWTWAHWKNCLFTDEAKFCRRSLVRTIRVWRQRGESRHSDTLTNTTEVFVGGVLVWGGICIEGRTDLVIINGNLNSNRYVQNILEPHVLPIAGAMDDPRAFVLVDDNARPHRSHIVDNFIAENDINRMEWPSKSPDINPIENERGL